MAENQQNLEGQLIKGYELQKLVGQGGFGAVYRAHQGLLKRDVALKVILPQYANDPNFIRRFEAEAQLVSQLENIHIVPLYDFWRDPSGAYLVMRWLRGGSLSDVLKKGHWPIHDTARIVNQLAIALAVAHRNGVVHRDVKPANILLDEEHNVYLADFGIAKELQHLSDYAAIIDKMESEMEGFIGSPDYISPEQILNQNVGPESDIYNFGLVIYELLTGKKPFEGLPVSTLISKHLMSPLPNIQELRPDLPEELNQVIIKATAKDPTERYTDTLTLAAEYREALAQTTKEELSELDKGTAAFDLGSLGLPDDFFAGQGEPENPYKGLRAFREGDAADFFGREDMVKRLLMRMNEDGLQSRFLALIGPSGSGKSSIMRAGLIPKLRNGAVRQSASWYIVDMVPGAYPMEELEAALLRIAVNPPPSLIQQMREDERGIARAIKRVLSPDTTLLIVIDQFEEVFTMVNNEAERQLFLRGLAEAVNDMTCPVRIMMTMRADFYDRPLLYPEFGKLISELAVTVLPLNTNELSRAITEPAERVGVIFDRSLVNEIIADVSDQPSTLPLLQYALTELFERREQRRLTREAYQAIGGVTGALARRADELYNIMTPTEQAAVRQLFLRLITPGEGTEDTRRRTRMDELLSLQVKSEVMQAVIDAYGQFRLLSFDRDPINRTPTVEVAHEALIRQWTRLRDWLTESRDDLRLHRRLAAAAAEWQASGRESSYLISGARLQQFEEWIQTSQIGLAEQERAYYDASLEERRRQDAAKAEQEKREASLRERARQFLIGLVAVMAIAMIGALSLSLFAFSQQAIAVANASTATIAQGQALLESDNAATSEANSRNLALISGAQLALANGDNDLAIRLGLEGNKAGSNIASRRTLAEAAYALGTRWIFSTEDRLEVVAYSPDGLSILAAGRDHDIYLIDAQAGTLIKKFTDHSDWVWDLAYSPDGTQAISASADTKVILWDIAAGQAIRTFEGHTAPVRGVAMSPDGTKIVSVSDDRTMIVWDAATGDILAQSEDTASVIIDVDVSPSGFSALTAHADGSVRFWNLQSAEPISILGAEQGGHTDQVWAVKYLPDESGFVSASQDSTIIRWSFETFAPVMRYVGHNARVTSLDISADASMIASSSEDNTIILWDMGTASIIHRFIGHSFLVYGVAISPDMRTLASGAWDNTVRLWDMHNGAQLAAYSEPNAAEIMSVAVAPDGTIATASNDGSVLLWRDGQSSRLGEHAGGAKVVAFNADGSLLLSAGADNLVQLWDVATASMRLTFQGHSDIVNAVAFSPDGSLIASAGDDNTIILWDANTGEQRDRLFGHTFHIKDIDFSPNGEELVSGGYDNLVLIWDVGTRQVLHRLEGHSDWVLSVEYSPNGVTVLSASADNSLILWEAESGTRLRQYEGHTALVYDAHYSSDGNTLISSSADRSILIWDILTGQVIQRLDGHRDAVYSLSFSPDSKSIISAGADASLRLWALRLSIEELSAWISENRYTADLSCVEQELYGIGSSCPTPTPFFLPNSRA
jgi:WD40 repeat protein